MSTVREQVESECLRDAIHTLEGIAKSPYDPDRYSAQAFLADVDQKLGRVDGPDTLQGGDGS